MIPNDVAVGQQRPRDVRAFIDCLTDFEEGALHAVVIQQLGHSQCAGGVRAVVERYGNETGCAVSVAVQLSEPGDSRVGGARPENAEREEQQRKRGGACLRQAAGGSHGGPLEAWWQERGSHETGEYAEWRSEGVHAAGIARLGQQPGGDQRAACARGPGDRRAEPGAQRETADGQNDAKDDVHRGAVER